MFSYAGYMPLSSTVCEILAVKCDYFGPKSALLGTPLPFDAPDGVDTLKLSDSYLAQEN